MIRERFGVHCERCNHLMGHYNIRQGAIDLEARLTAERGKCLCIGCARYEAEVAAGRIKPLPGGPVAASKYHGGSWVGD